MAELLRCRIIVSNSGVKLVSTCLVDLNVEISAVLFGIIYLIARNGQSGAAKELGTIEA